MLLFALRNSGYLLLVVCFAILGKLRTHSCTSMVLDLLPRFEAKVLEQRISNGSARCTETTFLTPVSSHCCFYLGNPVGHAWLDMLSLEMPGFVRKDG